MRIITKLCPPVPFASKSGGHVPQLLWERRPWMAKFSHMQNITPIGKAPAEKSVTVHKKKGKVKLVGYPAHTTYCGIKIIEVNVKFNRRL